MTATGAPPPPLNRPTPGTRFRFPLPRDGTGRGTVPVRPPIFLPSLPRRCAPGTGEEGGQQHQHRHRHRHVREWSNGSRRRRGGEGGTGAKRPRRSAGGRHGRERAVAGAGSVVGGPDGHLDATRGPVLRTRGAPTGAGKPREIPERPGVRMHRGERCHPWGWRRREGWGAGVLFSPLWVWGAGGHRQRHPRGWRRNRRSSPGVGGDVGLRCPNAVLGKQARACPTSMSPWGRLSYHFHGEPPKYPVVSN